MYFGAVGYPAPLLVTRDGETCLLTGWRSLTLGVDPEVLRSQAGG